MPTGLEARKYWERLVALESQMKSVMTFQKWQMVLLGAIFLAAIKSAVH